MRIIAVCSEIRRQHVNIFFQQNVETFYVKIHGKYSNQRSCGNLV
jgi:hypothetical protein